MCLASLKFWPKRKKPAKSPVSLPATTGSEQPRPTGHPTTTSMPPGVVDENNIDSRLTAVPDLQTSPGTDHSCSIPPRLECPPSPNPLSSPEPLPSLSKSSTGSLQERLWNEAYADIKNDEPKTVEAYEALLLLRYKDLEPQPMSLLNDQTITSALTDPAQMSKLVNAGLERSAKIANVKKNVEEFGRVAAPVKGVMTAVVQAAPQAAIAWSCLSFGLEILANPLTESSINREGITYVLGMMQWYWAIVELLLDENLLPDLKSQVERKIVQLYQKLLLYQMKSICRYFRNEIVIVLRDMLKWDDWTGELKIVKDAEDDLRNKLGIYQGASIRTLLDRIDSILTKEFGNISSLLESQRQMEKENDNRRWMAALRQTNPIDDKSRIQRDKGELLRESYRWVLDHASYTEWRKGSNRHLLWLHGDPGKGKTMLLCGVIDELEKDPLNTVSYFFCQASEATLNNATSVLRGLVYSLVYKYPQLVPYIRKERPAIGSEQFVDINAWETLSNILEHVLQHAHLQGVVLLLDALDECVDVDDRHKLLQFIQHVSSTHRVKIIITSRGWRDIRKGIEKESDSTFIISLEENEQHVSTAVAAYITREVQNLAKSDPYKREPQILTTVKNHLLRNANDTFLWVALVCKALKHSEIEEEEHVNDVLEASPPGLDKLYLRMFSQISSLKHHSALCVKILEIVSILRRTVTLAELHFILYSRLETKDNLEKLSRAIAYCGSMLNIQDNTIHVIHQSVVDFLTDPSLQEIQKIAGRHFDVFSGCLRGLSMSLKRDIYGLKAPDSHRDDIKKPEPDLLASLKYACVYWADHLNDSDFVDHLKDDSETHKFLQEKFLYWVEAMSLLHEVPQAIQAIQKVQTLVEKAASSAGQKLSKFLNDANRFLLFHREMIEKIPLQIYVSGLLFSPNDSVVKAYFQNEAPKWVTVTPGLDSTWSACLQRLEGHRNVHTAIYSHDGQWLLSGSHDGRVKLWHAGTGTCIRTVGGRGDEYNSEDESKSSAPVFAVAFSSDDREFISGSSNGLIKVWDRMTGSCLRRFRAHSESFTAEAMAISSNGCTTASALPNGSIYIAKIKGNGPARIIEYHEPFEPGYRGSNVALTADGQWAVVLVSLEKTLNIYNTTTAENIKIHTSRISFAVAWSEDGDWVASGGVGYVHIWERNTRQLVPEIKFKLSGDQNVVNCLAFSPDKEFLAAGLHYGISVWNTKTGALISTIDHSTTGNIHSLSFFPDGKRIVTTSSPDTIQVWDLSLVREGAYHNSTSSPNDLRFSDKDNFIGRYSDDRIRMWDNTSKSSTFLGPEPDAMALSRDNQRLASHGKGAITIWDVETVTAILQICYREGHIIFDGRDGRVGEYQLSSPECTQCVSSQELVECHDMTFRDDCNLATASQGLIKIWSTFDPSLLLTIDSGTNHASNITFSNDGQLLSCIARNIETGDGHIQSNNDTIKIWSITTEQCAPVILTGIAVPQGYDCQSFSFSADMQLIAAATKIATRGNIFFKAICLWDVKSGSLLRVFESQRPVDITASFDTKFAHCLRTQYGFIDLSGYLDKSTPGLGGAGTGASEKCFENGLDVGKRDAMPHFCGYGLSWDREWIVQDRKPLLWIPPDFRVRYYRGIGVSPVVDGVSVAWLRKACSAVRLYFIS